MSDRAEYLYRTTIRADERWLPDGGLVEVAQFFQDLLDKVPPEHRDLAWFQYEHESDWGEGVGTLLVSIGYWRPETDEDRRLDAEAAAQAEAEKRAAVQCREAEERAILARLRAKYPEGGGRNAEG